MKWRKDNTYVGLRGRTEPNHCKGSAQLYGTGAQVVPLDDWQRGNFHPAPPSEARYTIYAWVKRGHLTDEKEIEPSYALTVEEGKRRCDEWLAANVSKSLGQPLGSEAESAEDEAKDSAALNGDPDGI